MDFTLLFIFFITVNKYRFCISVIGNINMQIIGICYKKINIGRSLYDIYRTPFNPNTLTHSLTHLSVRTLLAGVPDYGCQINPQKAAVNFPVCVQWLDSGVRVLPSCCLFPWCGLLLDTHSLDVYKDYSR